MPLQIAQLWGSIGFSHMEFFTKSLHSPLCGFGRAAHNRRRVSHLFRPRRRPSGRSFPANPREKEIGDLLPNNQRQHRTCYALCHILYPVSAAQMRIFQMNSNSSSFRERENSSSTTYWSGFTFSLRKFGGLDSRH